MFEPSSEQKFTKNFGWTLVQFWYWNLLVNKNFSNFKKRILVQFWCWNLLVNKNLAVIFPKKKITALLAKAEKSLLQGISRKSCFQKSFPQADFGPRKSRIFIIRDLRVDFSTCLRDREICRFRQLRAPVCQKLLAKRSICRRRQTGRRQIGRLARNFWRRCSFFRFWRKNNNGTKNLTKY